MILLDTSVLSAALRRRRRSAGELRAADSLAELIGNDVPVAIPGIVLQELLSGVGDEAQFARLADLTHPFPVIMAERKDHVAAARIANGCRRRGARMAPYCGLTLFPSR